MRNFTLFILCVTICCFSCKKDSEEVTPADIGHGYAALELGKYVVYDVDSIVYDDFTNSIDTFSFQIKELVAESYTDLEGEEAFKINRYKKTDTTSWELKDVWNAKLIRTNYQKVEENVRFVKLIFPVRENATWNSNSMNHLALFDNNYESVDVAESIGGFNLLLVLTVAQLEEINLIEQRLFQEKYASGIGLVYKKSMDLVRNDLSSPWRGYDVTMTLNSYGG